MGMKSISTKASAKKSFFSRLRLEKKDFLAEAFVLIGDK